MQSAVRENINDGTRNPPAVFLIFFFLVLWGGSLISGDAVPVWRYVKTREGVKLYKRTFPGSGIIEVKGVTDVNAPAEAIDMLFRDIPAFTGYMHKCMVSRAVHYFSDEEMILYNVTKLPWPLSPRDVVVHASVLKDFTHGNFTVRLRSLSAGNAEKWVPLNKKYVRMYTMIGTFHVKLLSRQRCRIAYTVHADPTGLPAFVVNMFSDDNPRETLRGIRRMARKKKYIEAGKKSKYLPYFEKFFKEKAKGGK